MGTLRYSMGTVGYTWGTLDGFICMCSAAVTVPVFFFISVKILKIRTKRTARVPTGTNECTLGRALQPVVRQGTYVLHAYLPLGTNVRTGPGGASGPRK